MLVERQAGDIVFSNHRCHGHFLAYGGEPRRLFAELMGKTTGVCGGRGGSQHLQWKNFYSNGVQGGIVPVATGMALAEKLRATGAATIVFLGDGTLGEGAVYEALNMAALWQVPILFVVEDNGIAQTTPVEKALAGSIAGRFAAFGIPTVELDSSNVLEIQATARQLLAGVRGDGLDRRDQTHPSGMGPRGLILHTCRFGPHSKGDDTRSPEQVAGLRRQRDPLELLDARLDEAERATIIEEVQAEIAAAFEQARLDPFPQSGASGEAVI